MSRYHLVRVGALGQVGRFWSVDATRYPRGSHVVARTPRGLEVGEVIAPPGFESQAEADGSIVRGMTVEDHLLSARLERNRQAAYEACRLRLAEFGAAATLLDVEHLFDGQTIVFYFLGPQPPEIEAFTGELAEAYEAQAQVRAFADSLTHGCGPGCGTDEATGGCGGCDTGCAVAGLCATRKR